MKLIAPAYYPRFRCLAGDCRHTCCRGWEIDVDETALTRYEQVGGSLGDKLHRAIDRAGDAPHFRLDQQENCPFLTGDGLCELILRLGEDSLCQVCADHPRYRGFLTDRTEIGLGLCCEAAARLILTWPENVDLITLEDDGGDEAPTAEERAFLQLRERLTAVAQDRSRPIAARVDALEAMSGTPLPWNSLPRWVELLLTLERLDEAWTQRLTALMDAPPPAQGLSPEWDAPLEQLLVCLVYRHLTGALEDGDAAGRLAFVVLGWKLICALFLLEQDQTLDTLTETVRLWASEIEYSDDNTAALLDALDEGGL
ncbi:MAG: flagellin lysine-N-methylase [Eubacteriales bacterium]|nr:flagellin lysine-N-methylase [Eubacteriales bacterium]